MTGSWPGSEVSGTTVPGGDAGIIVFTNGPGCVAETEGTADGVEEGGAGTNVTIELSTVLSVPDSVVCVIKT